MKQNKYGARITIQRYRGTCSRSGVVYRASRQKYASRINSNFFV